MPPRAILAAWVGVGCRVRVRQTCRCPTTQCPSHALPTACTGMPHRYATPSITISVQAPPDPLTVDVLMLGIPPAQYGAVLAGASAPNVQVRHRQAAAPQASIPPPPPARRPVLCQQQPAAELLTPRSHLPAPSLLCAECECFASLPGRPWLLVCPAPHPTAQRPVSSTASPIKQAKQRAEQQDKQTVSRLFRLSWTRPAGMPPTNTSPLLLTHQPLQSPAAGYTKHTQLGILQCSQRHSQKGR